MSAFTMCSVLFTLHNWGNLDSVVFEFRNAEIFLMVCGGLFSSK